MTWSPSRELDDSIAMARLVLTDEPDGHLSLGARRRIWAALGPVWHMGRYAIVAEGSQRRTNLAIRCVRLVLPIWERRQPENHDLHNLFRTSDRYLLGQSTPEDLDSRAVELSDLAESLEGDAEESAVGFAAFKAAITALWDEQFDPAAIDPAASDADPLNDWIDWDSSLWAAVAFAGGAPVSPAQTFDRDRLRQFWT